MLRLIDLDLENQSKPFSIYQRNYDFLLNDQYHSRKE
jgi:hypothetical protein